MAVDVDVRPKPPQELAPPATDDRTTFAELVLVHHLRQTELYRLARSGAPTDEIALGGPADVLYRRRLAAFEAEHGKLVHAYWCTYEISAVAVTEQTVRLPWWRLRRAETRTRFFAETSWATRDCPEIAHQLHKIDTLAVRADEVLRGTSEHIGMQLVLAAASHVLSAVDQEGGPPKDPAVVRRLVDQSEAEIAQARHYYDQAGENAARITYAGGMLRGALALAVLGTVTGLILWAAGAFHRDGPTTWTLLATLAAGGVGAAVSVLLRMARGNFAHDFELGRKVTRRLAMARPFVGAAFAVILFLALKSDLVDVGGLQAKSRTIYFYVTIGFLAGFSERWARVVIESAVGASDDEDGPAKKRLTHRRQPAAKT